MYLYVLPYTCTHRHIHTHACAHIHTEARALAHRSLAWSSASSRFNIRIENSESWLWLETNTEVWTLPWLWMQLVEIAWSLLVMCVCWENFEKLGMLLKERRCGGKMGEASWWGGWTLGRSREFLGHLFICMKTVFSPASPKTFTKSSCLGRYFDTWSFPFCSVFEDWPLGN